jgi:hypothetical protein
MAAASAFAMNDGNDVNVASVGLPDAPSATTSAGARISDATPRVSGMLPRTALKVPASSRYCNAHAASADECGIQWQPLLRQSFTFLLLQHGVRLARDANARGEIARGPWFSKWMDAAGKQDLSRWDDGDAFVNNYIGHPLMGAVTSFVFIQNDPRGRDLMPANSRAYWTSRLKAMAFTAAYSAQWEIGLLSEASLGNTGRAQYTSQHSGRVTNGTGLVDYVVTPVGGAAWAMGEDLIDRHLLWRLEAHTASRWALAGMSLLNPGRSAANLLRGKTPWYRDGRFTRTARMALPFQNAGQ